IDAPRGVFAPWMLDLAAVTPTMLAFRMPVDCFGPARLELRLGQSRVDIPFCDADGCVGQPAGVACRDDGNACTRDACDGAGTCAHQPQPAGTECRPAAGPCDVVEVCDGTDSPWPADGKRRAGDVGRPALDPCARPETCDGAGDACPPDRLFEATHICRQSVGTCDLPERCILGTAACPPDAVKPARTVCRPAAGPCDVAEVCDGVTGA